MTVYQTLQLVKQYHYGKLSGYDKKFVDDMLDGLEGLGDVNDLEAKEYLGEKQIRYVRQVGKKFLITEKTKL